MASYSATDAILIKHITKKYPCRSSQIRALAALVSPHTPSPKNVVLHGLAATGKSTITKDVLEYLEPLLVGDLTESEEKEESYAMIRSAECITARHMLERTVGQVAKAVQWKGKVERCEDVGRLVVLLEKMLASNQLDRTIEPGEERARTRKFILVFDGIDKQRDAPHTLLPALGRLSEIIPNLTTVFIVTSPRPHFLHTINVVYINFPAYTKPEALSILSSQPPSLDTILPTQPSPDRPSPTEEQLKNLWTRYLAAIWDTFASHAARDLVSFRSLANKVWPKFVRPVSEGRFLATDFQRLFISQRALFRDESVMIPSIVSQSSISATTTNGAVTTKAITKAPHLPYTSRILLLAAYLCSYIPSRNDSTIFSKLSAKKRRRGGALAAGTTKGGGARKGKNTLAQRRRIDRKLLGPQAFVLERLLAVFWVVWEEASHSSERGGKAFGGRKGLKELSGSADVLAQVATLSSLRLIVRTGKEEIDGGGKLRVNVGWEVVRSLGRGVGVELGEWLE